jgi:outer membrane protein
MVAFMPRSAPVEGSARCRSRDASAGDVPDVVLLQIASVARAGGGRARRTAVACNLLSTGVMLRALTLLALVVPALARAQPMPSMTLPQALAYARDHEPRIKAALARQAARRADVAAARAEWLPRVGATAQIFGGTVNNSTALYLGTAETFLPRIGGRAANGTSWTPAPSTLVGASLTQEVFDFGRIAAATALADASSDVARAESEATALDVQLSVEESFAAVLAARHVSAATDEAYKRAVTHRDFAAAAVKSGLQPPVSLTRAQADVGELQVRRVRAAAGLEAARAALAASMAHDSLQVDVIEPANDDAPPPTLNAVLDEARAKNPALAATLASLRAAAAETRATSRELLPNVFATAAISGRAGGLPGNAGNGPPVPPGDGWAPDVPDWSIGLVFQWRLFDGTLYARRAAARARQDAAGFDVEAMRRMLGLDCARAWLALDAALRVLPGLGENVSAAQANFAQADARFRAGLGTIIELADAESLLVNAELQLAVGRFDVARARAELGRVVGHSLIAGKGS